MLIKIDIERFFESISERQIYHVLRGLGYRALLAFEMTRLCTRVSLFAKKKRAQRWSSEKPYSIRAYVQPLVGHLPQGAPTSPLLANLVCKPLDVDLYKVATDSNCVVTRYADDITFSSSHFDRPNTIELVRRVDGILNRYGFKRQAVKTHIVSSGSRKIVTGLLVDRDKPSLPREFRDRIRCHLYYAAKFGIHRHCEQRGFFSVLGFRNHLKGLIVYARSIDRKFGDDCMQKFSSLKWDVLAKGEFDQV